MYLRAYVLAHTELLSIMDGIVGRVPALLHQNIHTPTQTTTPLFHFSYFGRALKVFLEYFE